MNANAFNHRGHGGNGEIIDPSTLLRAGNGKLTLRLRSGQESDNGCIKYFANKLHCMHSYNSEQITVNSEQ